MPPAVAYLKPIMHFASSRPTNHLSLFLWTCCRKKNPEETGVLETSSSISTDDDSWNSGPRQYQERQRQRAMWGHACAWGSKELCCSEAKWEETNILYVALIWLRLNFRLRGNSRLNGYASNSNGLNRIQTDSKGFEWIRMGSNGFRENRMDSNGFEWIKWIRKSAAVHNHWNGHCNHHGH